MGDEFADFRISHYRAFVYLRTLLYCRCVSVCVAESVDVDTYIHKSVDFQILFEGVQSGNPQEAGPSYQGFIIDKHEGSKT